MVPEIIISTLCAKRTPDRSTRTMRKIQAAKNTTFFPNCGYDFISKTFTDKCVSACSAVSVGPFFCEHQEQHNVRIKKCLLRSCSGT